MHVPRLRRLEVCRPKETKLKQICAAKLGHHGGVNSRNTSAATTVLSLSKGVCENGCQRMRSKRSILKRDAHGRMDTSRVSMHG